MWRCDWQIVSAWEFLPNDMRKWKRHNISILWHLNLVFLCIPAILVRLAMYFCGHGSTFLIVVRKSYRNREKQLSVIHLIVVIHIFHLDNVIDEKSPNMHNKSSIVTLRHDMSPTISSVSKSESFRVALKIHEIYGPRSPRPRQSCSHSLQYRADCDVFMMS